MNSKVIKRQRSGREKEGSETCTTNQSAKNWKMEKLQQKPDSVEGLKDFFG